MLIANAVTSSTLEIPLNQVGIMCVPKLISTCRYVNIIMYIIMLTTYG